MNPVYESESVIQRNVRRICEGCTVLIIAHGLTAVRDADRITGLPGVTKPLAGRRTSMPLARVRIYGQRHSSREQRPRRKIPLHWRRSA
jgi:hypothetical protein